MTQLRLEMSCAIDGILLGQVAASSPDPDAHSRSRKRKADTTFDHEGSGTVVSAKDEVAHACASPG